jgi:hypothetical protein
LVNSTRQGLKAVSELEDGGGMLLTEVIYSLSALYHSVVPLPSPWQPVAWSLPEVLEALNVVKAVSEPRGRRRCMLLTEVI